LDINDIMTPVESGHPVDVLFGVKTLDKRQQGILDKLPMYGSRAVIRKKDASMLDLSALTAATGDEFAMFTHKSERLIIRGNSIRVPIDVDDAEELYSLGYRWSGHTHPGVTSATLIPSDGDMAVLDAFQQKYSAIYNSTGKFKMVIRSDENEMESEGR